MFYTVVDWGRCFQNIYKYGFKFCFLPQGVQLPLLIWWERLKWHLKWVRQQDLGPNVISSSQWEVGGKGSGKACVPADISVPALLNNIQWNSSLRYYLVKVCSLFGMNKGYTYLGRWESVFSKINVLYGTGDASHAWRSIPDACWSYSYEEKGNWTYHFAKVYMAFLG